MLRETESTLASFIIVYNTVTLIVSNIQEKIDSLRD